MTDIARRYFYQLLYEALRSERVALGRLSVDYVAAMLDEFVVSRMLEWPQEGMPPLAWYHQSAASSEGSSRIQSLRMLGDTALFLSGFLVDYVERSTGLGYYVDMGRSAYRQAGNLASHPVMLELADKFSAMVGVLNAMANETTLGRDLTSDQLYELYCRGGDASLWRRLASSGAIPIIGAEAVG